MTAKELEQMEHEVALGFRVLTRDFRTLCAAIHSLWAERETQERRIAAVVWLAPLSQPAEHLVGFRVRRVDERPEAQAFPETLALCIADDIAYADILRAPLVEEPQQGPHQFRADSLAMLCRVRRSVWADLRRGAFLENANVSTLSLFLLHPHNPL